MEGWQIVILVFSGLGIFNSIAFIIFLNLTMNKLARKLSLPVNTLSQVINQNAGEKFRDFINSFRIKRARQVMPAETGKGFSIASTAFECGFNSLSAFNRAFRKHTGMTPSEYLKSGSDNTHS